MKHISLFNAGSPIPARFSKKSPYFSQNKNVVQQVPTTAEANGWGSRLPKGHNITHTYYNQEG